MCMRILPDYFTLNWVFILWLSYAFTLNWNTERPCCIQQRLYFCTLELIFRVFSAQNSLITNDFQLHYSYYQIGFKIEWSDSFPVALFISMNYESFGSISGSVHTHLIIQQKVKQMLLPQINWYGSSIAQYGDVDAINWMNPQTTQPQHIASKNT